MTDVDRTPEGDPIHTETIWLGFDDGEVAITADLTKWDAAMRRLALAIDTVPDH
jgi:hypothetical protein